VQPPSSTKRYEIATVGRQLAWHAELTYEQQFNGWNHDLSDVVLPVQMVFHHHAAEEAGIEI
jgi:hypothetical protein